MKLVLCHLLKELWAPNNLRTQGLSHPSLEVSVPVPRCTVTLLSGLGQRKRNWEAKRSFMVGKTQDFQCVPSPWNREELVKNWKLPSAARTSVLPITGDAIDYCIYSRSCFALLSHPKILVQTVCGESMGALPGCSLMEESQWMAHMGTPWGSLSLVSIYLPSHVLCKGHLTSG